MAEQNEELGTLKRQAERGAGNRPSITQVAQRARVSIATVSRVLNNRDSVKPDLVRRVRQAIEQTGYTPNVAARSLSSGRTRLLGVIISNLMNPFFPELLQHFEEEAVSHGYEVLVASTSYDLSRMDTCIDRMLERKVDGVAVMTFGMEAPLLSRFVDRGVPLVFMDRAPAGDSMSAIEVDYDTGIHQAIQHLAVLGHRRIGFVAGPVEQVSVANRRAAVKRALHAIGLAEEPELIFAGDHSFRSGNLALNHFVSLQQPPTAILCSNDVSAFGVMHAASSHGLEIPKDLSIVGFDGIDFGAYMMPPLTSVVMSRLEIANSAIQALLSKADPERFAHARVRRVSTHLLVRRTTAIPAGALHDLKPR